MMQMPLSAAPSSAPWSAAPSVAPSASYSPPHIGSAAPSAAPSSSPYLINAAASASFSPLIASAAPVSGAPATGPTMINGRPTKTPISLVNNGVHINPGAGSNQPTIFSSETAQVLQLPSRHGYRPPEHRTEHRAGADLAYSGPSSSELLFGGRPSEMHFAGDTSAQELSRLEIVTMRQLQRALQNKITQSTRNPMDVWSAFTKLDRRKRNALNLADLVAAVRGFNLVASEELIAQLLQALDRDHDGVLSLTEFVNGLRADNNHGSSAVQLQEQPDYAVSSRRHFRNIKFHHPLHNMLHLSGDPRF